MNQFIVLNRLWIGFFKINFIKDYLNLDVLCIEVIQGLAGSIGIILTVPITAFIASYFCKLNLKKV